MLNALNAVISFNFQHPEVLWGVPVAAAILLLLLLIDFVRTPLTPEERMSQRRKRVWIFVARLFLATLLLTALAEPYGQTAEERQGNPRVTFLIDTSGSMEYMDATFANSLAESVGKQVTAKVRTIGSPRASDLGSAILQNLEPGGNILLVSDGNANLGPALEDVAFYASTINATVSAVNLTPLVAERSVLVSGPGKVVAESEITYTVIVSSTKQEETQLIVDVDGARVLDKKVLPGSYTFSRRFGAGTHKIEARLAQGDAYLENNAFRKVVTVLPQPKILVVSEKNSPLDLLLNQLYDVEKRSSLPTDLSPYYTVVINDAPIERLSNARSLHEYLIDEEGDFYGGGAVFFGGLRSFDRGSYSGSLLDPFLPVRVGQGERKKGDSAIVFVLDMSGSTGGARGFTSKAEHDQFIAQGGKVHYSVADLEGNWMNAYYYPSGDSTSDVIKAQAINAIEQLQLENRVGVIAFGLPPREAAASPDEFLAESVKVIQPLDYLYNNRNEITEKIPRIVPGGPTAADTALRGAVEMLRPVQGDKNIVLLTNGRYSAGLGAMSPQKQQLLNIVSNAHKLFGIGFMTIGVGVQNDKEFPLKVDELFMEALAIAGDGTYDRGTKLNTLLIKWGDPQAKKFGDEFSLVRLSLTHFITRDIDPTAVLNGYNEVVPKDTALLLVTSDSGQPALTTWQYGNGRIATWTVFGGNNLGQLLNQENSLLVSRTVNWAIGDPQRKESHFVDIPDGRINEEMNIRVRSDSVVSSEALDFTKEGEFYTASFRPSEIGYGNALGAEYAVNRPSEYDRIGMSNQLAGIVEMSGGKIFKPSEDEAIIEHVKEASRKVTVQREVLAQPFIVAAALLFLLEIFLRRIVERRT